jgi:hypothetical protein
LRKSSHIEGGIINRKEEERMIGHNLFLHGMVGVLGGALLITSVGCSEPLSTREKAALIGGGLVPVPAR